MAYTKYSLTPANNTAAPPDGAPEGMLPSAVNDTMRDMMAQIRDVGDGVRDGTYTMTAPKITGGTITGAAITSSSYNGTVGATTASTGAFTTINASTSITNAALTSGRVTYAGASGLLSDSANFTYNGTLLSVSATGSSATTLAQFRQLISGVNTGDARITVGNEVYNPLVIGQNAGSSGFTYGTTNDAFFVNTANSGMLFGTNGTEKVKITSAGLVGIGTSSPSFASGGGLAIYNASAARLALKSNADGANNGLQLGIDSGGLAFIEQRENNPLTFSTNSTERMRIDSSGNLGLGVTPSAWGTYKALQGGTGSAIGFRNDGNPITLYTANLYVDGTNYRYISGSSFYGLLYAQDATSGKHTWQTAPSSTGIATLTQAMTLDASGRLGIGTTSPSAKLDVNGQINTTNIVSGIRNNITSTDRISVTGATTIFSIATSGSSVGASSAIVLVNGYDTGTTTNSFTDLVLYIGGVTPVVVSTVNRGVPAARVYTTSGIALQLTMASGTYNVSTSSTEQAC